MAVRNKEGKNQKIVKLEWRSNNEAEKIKSSKKVGCSGSWVLRENHHRVHDLFLDHFP